MAVMCPKCRNEYRDGIKVCADCGCALVGGEEAVSRVALLAGPDEQVQDMYAYLRYCKITSAVVETETSVDGEVISKLLCEEKDEQIVRKHLQVYIKEEQQKKAEEFKESMSKEELEELYRVAQAKQEATRVPSGVYENSAEKAKEYKSTAVTLIGMGGIGVILMLLSWFGLLPFYFGGEGNVLMHGVMILFFGGILAGGIHSAMSVKELNAQAQYDDKGKEVLLDFCKEYFTKALLDRAVSGTMEEAYFERMNYMRGQVKFHLSEEKIPEALMEATLEEHYDSLYES
ncbi:MAG: hypothetical protein R3Y47_03660 [Lachnospiraceae bacterium]